MYSARQNPSSPLGPPERRFYHRRQILPLAYVDVGASRGTIFDISEGGLGVHAAASEIEVQVCTVTFPLPGSPDWVEINGVVVWVSQSGREAGIRFVDPPETVRARIQKWVFLESSARSSQDRSSAGLERLPPPARSYSVREVRFDDEIGLFLKPWIECHRRFPGHTLHGDPEWIAQRFKYEKENVRVFFVEKAGEIIGAVPFVLNREPLVCELGQFALSRIPLRTLCLQGYTLNVPEEVAAYDKLFSQILQSDIDAIYIENAKAESFLWSYLQNSALGRQEFRFYTKTGPLPHCLIRLDGTFESYLKRFSSKARKNRLRELKNLQERSQLTLLRVSQPSELDAFLEAAGDLSRKTWQFKRFGRGLAARDPETVRGELQFSAERGWLRSYVLKCDGVPCSFILGHQYASSFYAESVGVDDAWRSYSVGTVIMLLVLKNLFEEEPPEFYDFGTPIRFHENFATESYPEARVWLFRRRAYPLLASAAYHACNAVSMNTGKLLQRLGLKSKVNQVFWKRG